MYGLPVDEVTCYPRQRHPISRFHDTIIDQMIPWPYGHRYQLT